MYNKIKAKLRWLRVQIKGVIEVVIMFIRGERSKSILKWIWKNRSDKDCRATRRRLNEYRRELYQKQKPKEHIRIICTKLTTIL